MRHPSSFAENRATVLKREDNIPLTLLSGRPEGKEDYSNSQRSSSHDP